MLSCSLYCYFSLDCLQSKRALYFCSSHVKSYQRTLFPSWLMQTVACEMMTLNYHARTYSLVSICNAVYLSKSEVCVCLQIGILWYTYIFGVEHVKQQLSRECLQHTLVLFGNSCSIVAQGPLEQNEGKWRQLTHSSKVFQVVLLML